MGESGSTRYYREPGWFTTNVFNRLVSALTRAGISVGDHGPCRCGVEPVENGARTRSIY